MQLDGSASSSTRARRLPAACCIRLKQAHTAQVLARGYSFPSTTPIMFGKHLGDGEKVARHSLQRPSPLVAAPVATRCSARRPGPSRGRRRLEAVPLPGGGSWMGAAVGEGRPQAKENKG
jgi:hypothetical protein